MTIIEQYLLSVAQPLQPLVIALANLVQSADSALKPSVKWGNLTFHHDHNVCAIAAHKTHVNVQIWRGAELDDPEQLLEGVGKTMRHIKCKPDQTLKKAAIKKLIKQASLLAQG